MRTILFVAALIMLLVGVVAAVVAYYAEVTAWPVGVALILVFLLGVVLVACGAAVKRT